ncbi:hypothetical protein ABEP00_11720, partial [Heyndrickxia sporothermodurans]
EVKDGAKVGIIEPTIDNILKGIYVGSGKAVGDTIEGWKGLYKLAEKYLGPTSSPDLLLKTGLIGTELYLDSKAVFGRAVDTGKYMVKAVKDGFVRDVINGDAESRSKYFTYLFTTLGIGALGDKGISKAGNVSMKVGHIGRITTKVEGLTPSMGTVTAGPIPYNVMNHLEDQIQLATRKAFGDETKGTGKYQVGAYKDIKGIEGLDAHHAGQKAAMKKLVDNYDLNTEPAINVPKVGHTIKGPHGIVSRSTKGIDNPRQLLARDIRELRRVYDGIPNSALKELIELNKKMYPEMRK